MKITIKINFTNDLSDLPTSTRKRRSASELPTRKEWLMNLAEHFDLTNPEKAAEIREMAATITE